MDRIWKILLFPIAAAYFVVDGLFSYVTEPVAAWIARKRVFERARRWIVSLRPYPSLALFAIPLIVLEPAKPLAGYLVATDHFAMGAAVFVIAEVLKLTFVERLFQLNRNKLLSIPAFNWGYGYWRRMLDVIELIPAWRFVRRMVVNAGRQMRIRWLHLKITHRLQLRALREGSRG